MPAIKNAPLVEAIFEIRWGSKGQNSFEFSQDEQSLLPGKVDAFAAEAGFLYPSPLDPPPAQTILVYHKGFLTASVLEKTSTHVFSWEWAYSL